jgi:hypothetical protein
LQPRQYRSLLINSARRMPPAEGEGSAPVQTSGAGLLDVDAALRLTATAFPTALSFGAGGSTAEVSRDLAITNIGRESETYTVRVVPQPGSPEPQLSLNTFSLEPGATRTIPVNWRQSGLAEGEYQGVVLVRGTASDAELRIPYWYAVTSSTPRFLSSFLQPATAPTNGSTTLNIRVTDPSGVILTAVEPQVSVESGDGFVVSSRSIDDIYPGVWRIQLRMGPFPGPNVFVVRAGEVTRRITIRGQ